MKALCLLLISLFTATAATDPFAISSLPVTITNPGNYYVTRNLVLTETNCVAGILITASNVLLDLKGLILEQAHPEGSPLYRQYGIWAQSPATIRNGTLLWWFGVGVVMNGGLLENVRMTSCETGVVVAQTLVRHCKGNQIYEIGMSGTASRFEFCSSTWIRGVPGDFAEGLGFRGDESTTFFKCKVYSHGMGFLLINDSGLERCTARRTSSGITIDGSQDFVRRCTITRNSAQGVYVSAGSSGSLIQSNSISYNGDEFVPDGSGGVVLFGNEARVENNRIVNNQPVGIFDTGVSNVFEKNIVRPRDN